MYPPCRKTAFIALFAIIPGVAASATVSVQCGSSGTTNSTVLSELSCSQPGASSFVSLPAADLGVFASSSNDGVTTVGHSALAAAFTSISVTDDPALDYEIGQYVLTVTGAIAGPAAVTDPLTIFLRIRGVSDMVPQDASVRQTLGWDGTTVVFRDPVRWNNTGPPAGDARVEILSADPAALAFNLIVTVPIEASYNPLAAITMNMSTLAQAATAGMLTVDFASTARLNIGGIDFESGEGLFSSRPNEPPAVVPIPGAFAFLASALISAWMGSGCRSRRGSL